MWQSDHVYNTWHLTSTRTKCFAQRHKQKYNSTSAALLRKGRKRMIYVLVINEGRILCRQMLVCFAFISANIPRRHRQDNSNIVAIKTKNRTQFVQQIFATFCRYKNLREKKTSQHFCDILFGVIKNMVVQKLISFLFHMFEYF